jgi:tRNA A-37 threonylcarbamoyl transferase component Bud32
MSSPKNSDLPVTADALIQMGRRPEPFLLELDAVAGDAAAVSCDEVVRVIPGKRLVCRGEWRGQSVYTKVYLGPDKYWQAECRGLQAMSDKGIDAPTVLHAGTADNGALHVIVLAAIEPAQTLAHAWEQTDDSGKQLKLLQLAMVTIAQHHQAGLEQNDIHLDNFLLADERLYTLDGGGIRYSGNAELPLRQSRDNLARFFAQFYPRFDQLAEAVVPVYVRQRGWPDGTVSGAKLLQRVHYFRHRRQRQFLKKIFRECSAFAGEKRWRSFRVYDRALASPALLQLLADPDASLQRSDARTLKQGNTCTLWSVMVDGRQLVVKRYNIKGFLHGLSRAWRRTRAAISWKNAHRLAMYGILGARPVALYERRFGPLRGKAWLIMEYVRGDDITRLCEQPRPDSEATIRVVSDMTDLLDQLAQCQISHGDMKGTNFIQSAQGIVVIDLDAMREHVSTARFRRAQQRDLQRFMHNWQQCPTIGALFRDAIQHKRLVTGL